ncbi:tyrosine-type recombinase/integrase [Pseudomonas putida]|uniref:tyrosine-type recombinase/integrase n=1 Tax=Pseudomonas putida TaxID=303 RepID=UPI0018ABDB1B|nr:tyrosine-type recombinase/integrase [Pseudomonas putida]MBF8766176.1 tyrosine-type recombinase/integrase [Pseudomonas putida]
MKAKVTTSELAYNPTEQIYPWLDTFQINATEETKSMSSHTTPSQASSTSSIDEAADPTIASQEMLTSMDAQIRTSAESDSEAAYDTDSDTDLDELAAEEAADEEDCSDELKEDFEQTFGTTSATPSFSLKNKLSVSGGNFPISAESNYLDDTWHLPRAGTGAANNVHFNRELEGSNTLKRAIIFHTIREYAPLGNIRSYTSARHHGHLYRVMEDYVFRDFHLTAKPEHIRLISMDLIRAAFDKARKHHSKSDLFQLYQTLRIWVLISDHKLIPEELCIGVDLTEFDSPELRKDIYQRYFRGNVSSWIPFSEEDLESLTEYSLFWIEKAAPELLKLRNYLKDEVVQHKDGAIERTSPLVKFEELTNITIDGKQVMTCKLRKAIKHNKPLFCYTWLTEYAYALDNLRNAIFIMVALITGARKSELAPIKFSDLRFDENDEYWLTIHRHKTAHNPTVGEADELPIPKFIGDAIRQFENLRDIGRFKKSGWLFQSNVSASDVKTSTSGIVQIVIVSIRNAVPVDRIHCHRFRKTIAEILINRDERNIDIIRALFGHKSYAMTLQYISRNPLMVRTVALAIEQNYTREFHEIVAGIRYGGHSGEAAIRISQQISKRPEEFSGKQLKISLMSYISHLLAAGEQLFVRRTAVGTFCLSGEHYNADNVPPCLMNRKALNDNFQPDPSNCQPDCKKIVVLESAKQSLSDNVDFYTTLLNRGSGKLSPKAERELVRRITASQHHLANLEATGSLDSMQAKNANQNRIEVRHV